MTILDANILLYGYNFDSPEHRVTRDWLDDLFARSERIGIPWLSLWAFLRISTNARAVRHPFSWSEAFEIVRDLIAQPNVTIVDPGSRHAEILRAVTEESRISGPHMTDAVLAALAVEQGATLASTDRGFARFKGLKWVNPLDRGA
jgi:toxin-antitoxin system PIN domain toxin